MRLMAVLMSGLVVAAPLPASAMQADIDGTLANIFAPWTAGQVPGCVVGISSDGSPSVTRAFGMADIGNVIPNRPDTRFEAGSVSKQFVAAAILMLVEQGRLSLDDDIRKYLPEVPDYGRLITVDQLLDHTSGLRDWGFAMEIAGWPRTTRAYANNDVLAFVARQTRLNHAPGADYSYTNTGYVLLAIILERVTGNSLADFTRIHLFEPLGMRFTGWRTDFRTIERNRAIAYIETPAGNVERMPFENVYGDAGLLTTVGDLLIWNDALAAGRLGAFVGKAMAANAHLADGRTLTYARGLNVPIDAAIPEISHGGAIGGYRAWLARFPSKRLSIALLCNAGEALGVGRGAKLGRAVADALLGIAPAAAPTRADRSAARHEGLFVSEKTGLPLILVSDARGLARDDGTRLVREASGHYAMQGSRISFDGADMLRRDDPDGTTDIYRRHAIDRAGGDRAALSGIYASDELQARYRVVPRPGGLRLQLVDRPDHVFDVEPLYRDAWLFDTRLGKRTGIVRFVRDASGAVISLSIGWDARVRAAVFERIAD
ncbi:serine hydrolase domain-containing protein [Sphingomonas colocasiae]|uniref:Beta-lactamase family protein n=1 Tax=Sphingomonas colocasiae TaxID=1848973 RepID=A0ABS7PUY6_9SPHN|nr:serine hydrolase domain-containing protein [Sphingomonas colocasiae]MBY8824475.1 beta-lactamase family protein [Sphingomonas colocasiae]